MTPEVQIALITAIGGVLVAMIGGVGLYFKAKLEHVAVQIDGRLTQLLEVSIALARAQGITEGTDTERQRVRDVDEERAEERISEGREW